MCGAASAGRRATGACTRGPEPDLLERYGAELLREDAARRSQNPTARFEWRQREGRSIRYAPDFASMTALVAYLGENCCAGAGCAPTPGRE